MRSCYSNWRIHFVRCHLKEVIKIHIVTVDWDYFFPNIDGYDWGHSEDFPIMYEWIWGIRHKDKNLRTGEVAKDTVLASSDYLDFWSKVCVDKPVVLSITESHKDLYQVIEGIGLNMNYDTQLWNFDAHHDMYDSGVDLSCGNWAAKLINEKKLKPENYHVIYPEWRRDEPDSEPNSNFVPTGAAFHYDIPEVFPVMPFLLHICRSSCWTPSWEDDKWIKFIEYWKKDTLLWKTKSYCEFSLKKRQFQIVDFKHNVENMEVKQNGIN